MRAKGEEFSLKCDIEVFKHLIISRENHSTARMMQVYLTVRLIPHSWCTVKVVSGADFSLFSVRGPTLLLSEDHRQPLCGKSAFCIFSFMALWRVLNILHIAQLKLWIQLKGSCALDLCLAFKRKEMCGCAPSKYKLIKIISYISQHLQTSRKCLHLICMQNVVLFFSTFNFSHVVLLQYDRRELPLQTHHVLTRTHLLPSNLSD